MSPSIAAEPQAGGASARTVASSSVVLPEPGDEMRFTTSVPAAAKRSRSAGGGLVGGQDVLADVHFLAGAHGRFPSGASGVGASSASSSPPTRGTSSSGVKANCTRSRSRPPSTLSGRRSADRTAASRRRRAPRSRRSRRRPGAPAATRSRAAAPASGPSADHRLPGVAQSSGSTADSSPTATLTRSMRAGPWAANRAGRRGGSRERLPSRARGHCSAVRRGVATPAAQRPPPRGSGRRHHCCRRSCASGRWPSQRPRCRAPRASARSRRSGCRSR